MNFFEHQDKARKRTLLLLVFYALAVIGTILAVYTVAKVCWYLAQTWSTGRPSRSGVVYPVSFDLWDPQSFLTITGIVCAVVLIGTAVKIVQLSSGGISVAKMLGGEAILPNTTDPDERKVLNVVEEMSIASGVPVPPVFLLKKEYGINAFAAGFSTQDAVIGVTSGAVKLLSRDELQGVITHEFSHIFNGDMRLNMHLTGFLSGLLLIALTGKAILHGFRFGGARVRTDSRGGGGGAAVLVIILFAVLLIAVGYIGVFFCNWIKSAVSRQREFLADASSAQFTRNPSGLAGALKKIAGLSDGSFVCQTGAEEVSHFFFANGVSFTDNLMFSTHPPLGLRIKMLDPSFDGKYPVIKSIAPAVTRTYRKAKTVPRVDKRIREWERKTAVFGLPLASAVAAPTAASMVASVGMVADGSLDKAGRILEGLPKPFMDAARSLSGATALVYGLLIDRLNVETRTRQLGYLSQKADPAVYEMLLKLLPDFSNLKIEFCLPLLDLATPALKTQSPALYRVFRKNIEALIGMDSTVTVFEFALKQVVLHHLDFFFGITKKNIPIHSTIGPVVPACGVLLSYLAGVGHVSRTGAEKAFGEAASELDPDQDWKFIPGEVISHASVEKSLRDMALAFPKLKEIILVVSKLNTNPKLFMVV